MAVRCMELADTACGSSTPRMRTDAKRDCNGRRQQPVKTTDDSRSQLAEVDEGERS